MDNSAWYLVYAKPMREIVAKQQLENQGYTVFLPLCKVKKRVRGVLKQQLEPFFPRYLFIYLNVETDNWAPIRSTIGVSGLVRFGGVAARVPATIIESLRQSSDDDAVVECVDPFNFQAGEQLQVVDGPFSGHDVVFSSMQSSERALVLLDIANRHTLLQVNVNVLAKS